MCGREGGRAGKGEVGCREGGMGVGWGGGGEDGTICAIVISELRSSYIIALCATYHFLAYLVAAY